MEWDKKYEIACNIIMAFSDIWPKPRASLVASSIKAASDIANTDDLKEIIKWAEDYAEQFYNERVK